jgi:hypothetical protein
MQDSLVNKIKWILTKYPDCKNSDNLLVVRALTHSVAGILRARQHIQNTLKLFKADEEVQQMREARAKNWKQDILKIDQL